MNISLFLAAVLAVAAQGAPRKAKNVILFIGDAGGIPTLHATSLYKHGHPNKLFIQNMPHLALMDTSAADAWVTDSAAGMSSIVTGQKTNNGVISQSATAVRGKKDGEVLQTILEYAEQ
jgi:alkaline phosphatase